ncbi:uncharacterized protein EV154DRAFT_504208 [Mucor mucedo]|uniref:uncharacterized protein n=1 Tax=Mucor mucedo TaxID=29922 RepID=UPI00221F0B83|nr:uncharacterized protein EV154DRAFT_504208 [Mucor mucedo]KAI7892579.1 hypothetical protein EV154DRAFT_504208 [Mucor mucedo]
MEKDIVETVPKEEEEYEVEKILAHKIVRIKNLKTIKYFIKWLNYDEADNTWEKQENVYAIDMIVQYWTNIPKTDKDRMLFESLQAKKENPIIIPSPVKVAKVITASPSPPSSPVLQPTLTEKPSIASFFTPKKQEERAPIASSSSSAADKLTPAKEKPQTTIDTFTLSPTPPPPTPAATATQATPASVSVKGKEKEGTIVLEKPTVIEVLSTTSSENGIDDVAAEMDKAAEEYKIATASSEDDNNGDEHDDSVFNNSKKRTRSTYTDYFTEQYKKKKRIGKAPVRQTEEEIESSASDSPKEQDTIIFDQAFTTDPVRDWSELAVKIEYIGKEVDGGPIYCAVKWQVIFPLSIFIVKPY